MADTLQRMQRAERGDDVTLDDKIDQWHEDPTITCPLHEYLGWTRREYRRWLETGDTRTTRQRRAYLRRWARWQFMYALTTPWLKKQSFTVGATYRRRRNAGWLTASTRRMALELCGPRPSPRPTPWYNAAMRYNAAMLLKKDDPEIRALAEAAVQRQKVPVDTATWAKTLAADLAKFND